MPGGKPTTIGTAILGGNKDLFSGTIQTLFREVNSCAGTQQKGWSDRDLGDFSIGSNSPYCSDKCYRSFFCCAPQKPDELQVKFLFSYKDNGRTHTLLVNNDGTEQSRQVQEILNRNRNQHITWFVHGLINDIYVEPIYNQTRDALLNRGDLVVLVDWHEGNRLYLQSMANVRTVGALLGQLMYKLKVYDRSTCTGFSLGSHICGEAGKYLKKHGAILDKCEGVDPAGPAFDHCSDEIKLDKSDCRLVTAMHTSQFESLGSLAFGQGFGTQEKTGSCDYWVNDGMDQPNCDNATLSGLSKKLFSGMFGKFTQDLEWAWECSHYRAVYYYLSQVRRDCNFIGREAKRCGDAAECTGVQSPGRGNSQNRDDGKFVGQRGKREKRNIINDFFDGVKDVFGIGNSEKDQRREEIQQQRLSDEWNEKPNRHNSYDEEKDRRGNRHHDSRGNRRPGSGSQRPDWLEQGSGSRHQGVTIYRSKRDASDSDDSLIRDQRNIITEGIDTFMDWVGLGGDDKQQNSVQGGRSGQFRQGKSLDNWDRRNRHKRPNKHRGSNRRPDWLERGQNDNSGRRPNQGSSSGRGNAPTQMSLLPDDACQVEYNADYKFVTTGKQPFC